MNRTSQMNDPRHELSERTRCGRRAAIRAALVLTLCAALAGIASGPPASAEPVRSRFVEAELVSNVKTIEPGVPFEIALRLSMEPGWHTYWENPGDTGLATTLDVELPDGFTSGELRFPYPHRFESGAYVSYGYEGDVLIVQSVTPPATLEAGEQRYIAARAEWTVCREDLCMPGGADLGIELGYAQSGGGQPDGYWSKRIESNAPLMPKPAVQWTASGRVEARDVTITLTPDAGMQHDPGTIEVFERRRGTLDHERTPQIETRGDGIEIKLGLASKKAPDELELVLVASRGWTAEGTPRAIVASAPLSR